MWQCDPLGPPCVPLLESFNVGHDHSVTVATVAGFDFGKGGSCMADVWKRCSGVSHVGGIFTCRG